MKKLIRSLLFITLVGFSLNVSADEELWAYYKVGSLEVSMNESITLVKNALSSKGFEVVGEYHPGNNDSLYVVAYTRNDLQKITLKVMLLFLGIILLMYVAVYWNAKLNEKQELKEKQVFYDSQCKLLGNAVMNYTDEKCFFTAGSGSGSLPRSSFSY